MQGARISVIIATLGRPSLGKILDDLKSQLSCDDQILVIADGLHSAARCLPMLNSLCSMHTYHSDTSRVGNAQRQIGQNIALKDVCWFVDDDDEIMPGAIESIRRAFQSSMQPCMFRMNYFSGQLPKYDTIEKGNVSTPMLVVPNIVDCPRWEDCDEYTADFEWISRVNAWQQVRWVDDVIYFVTRQGFGR